MSHLSKESRITFNALLIVPLIWIALNHFGFLEFLEYKTVDLRFKVRGNLSHQDGGLGDETVLVEGNKTIPRVPKVIYVNFDADTLSMDEVGERPWNRGFFRDVGEILLEDGNARVVAYDFIFSPKSTSSMVPEKNVYASDSAITQLVSKFPGQVVLASAFTNVQTPFLKNEYVDFLSKPPYLSEGFDASKMVPRYPEGPTYPIFSYQDERYVGINGPITIAPNSVDGMQRQAPLWFPGGGKAHAYNILGGKMAKLNLEDVESSDSKEAELVEVGEELHLVWKDSNNTLIETVPNRMPLVRNRNFHTFGVEALMAYYGVGEKEVEITEGNKRLLIRSRSGKVLVDVPLIEEQSMEINWFSNWKDEAEAEKIYLEAKEFFDQENYEEYVARGPQIMRLFLQRIEGLELPEKDSELLKVLEDLGLDEKRLRTADEFIKAAEGKIEPDKAPDSVRLEKLVAKIAENYLPPKLLSAFNPFCGMDDVLNYKRYLTENSEQIEKGKAGVFKMQRVLSEFRKLHYQYSDYNESLVLWSKFNKLDSSQSKEKESLLVALEKSESGTPIFKGLDNKASTKADAEQLAGELGDLNKKYETLKADQGLRRKLQNLKELEQKKLKIEGQIEKLKKQAEESPDAAVVIESTFIKPKQKDLKELDEKIEVLEEVSKGKLQDRKLNIEGQIEKLRKQAEESPGAAAVIESTFIKPKQKNLKELDEKLKKLEDVSTKDEISDTEFLQITAQAMSKAKALLEFNKAKLKEAEIQNRQYLSFFEQFENAIVLVGPTEATFQDLSPTPMDKEPIPKVFVHGNIIKTLSSGIYLERIWDGKLSGALLILVICLIMGYLAVNSAPWTNWVGVIFMLLFVAMALFLFVRNNYVMPLAAPSLAGISTFFIGLIVMMVVEQKAKGRLKGMFGSYVSADLVDQMVDSGEEPHLGGEETAITAFFSDVQAFSSFSELLTPTGLVDLMNEYLTAMTDILQEERGTLDKYIGDAIVAMYGAPIPMDDHAYQSVRTALLMQEKQLELRDKWAMEEEKWGKCYGLVKQMQTRIGCNTGTATVGNMGALDRFNYTMMGDMVNLAARCESGAKAYGAYIMITEETKLASEQTKQDIAFRYLDKIVVKGRSQPVAMYEPTGFMADLSQETQDCLDCFKQGIDKYLVQDWDGALKMFEKAKNMEPNKPGVTPGVKDNPSMILIDRCQVMKENPPGEDWDGVYVMTSK